ncbi:hypothetical protein T484DRAFT_3503510 [Baffinella frigidus]|nr:hypothetical protein T484DRAFT_3503510 [Cryptophyta sp. CCMP2293]
MKILCAPFSKSDPLPAYLMSHHYRNSHRPTHSKYPRVEPNPNTTPLTVHLHVVLRRQQTTHPKIFWRVLSLGRARDSAHPPPSTLCHTSHVTPALQVHVSSQI